MVGGERGKLCQGVQLTLTINIYMQSKTKYPGMEIKACLPLGIVISYNRPTISDTVSSTLMFGTRAVMREVGELMTSTRS
jgi:hypothetical protein